MLKMKFNLSDALSMQARECRTVHSPVFHHLDQMMTGWWTSRRSPTPTLRTQLWAAFARIVVGTSVVPTSFVGADSLVQTRFLLFASKLKIGPSPYYPPPPFTPHPHPHYPHPHLCSSSSIMFSEQSKIVSADTRLLRIITCKIVFWMLLWQICDHSL